MAIRAGIAFQFSKIMIGLAETDTHGEEGRCFKDGSVGLAASHGLGGCKTSIKRKWAKGGGEVKWKRKRWEDGRKRGTGGEADI